MMRDIYQHSSRTIAWLGRPTTLDHEGLTTLRRLGEAIRDHLLEEIASGNDESVGLPESTLEAFRAMTQMPERLWGTAAPAFTELKGISALLRNSWFERMWIIQEATVCRSLQLQSGHVTMSFDLLVLGAIVAMMTLVGKRKGNSIAGSGLRKLLTLAYIRANALEPESAELEIDKLIVTCRTFKATDPRDRIYALYGISSTDLSQLGLRTDYTVATRQAMIDATFALMRRTRSLGMLELAECRGALDPEWPSWIPSTRSDSDPDLYPWSFKQDRRPFEQTVSIAMIESLFQSVVSDDYERADEYNDLNLEVVRAVASEEMAKDKRNIDADLPKASLDFLQPGDDGTLCVHGQFLDRIEEIGPVPLLPAAMERGYGSFEHPTNYLAELNVDEEMSERLRDLPGELGEIFSKIWAANATIFSDWIKYVEAVVKMDSMVMKREKRHQYPTGDSVLKAYRKVVCAGQLLGMTEEEQAKIFDSWRKTIKPAVAIGNLKRSLGLQKPAGPFSLFLTSVTAHALYKVDINFLFGDAMSCIFGRRLAWTAEGYLAMVPAGARVGDFVFSLRGSSMAFVLRQCGDAWSILGPTWIHGMMEGQLIDEEAYSVVRLV